MTDEPDWGEEEGWSLPPGLVDRLRARAARQRMLGASASGLASDFDLDHAATLLVIADELLADPGETDYTTCPYYTRSGDRLCTFGCHEEPVCITNGPHPMDEHPLVVMWAERAQARSREIDALIRHLGHKAKGDHEEPF